MKMPRTLRVVGESREPAGGPVISLTNQTYMLINPPTRAPFSICVLAFLAMLWLAVAALGQEPAPVKRSSPNVAQPSKSKGGKSRSSLPQIPQTIPGYTIQKVHGFTVIVNNEVLAQDGFRFERKPAEVLELELGAMVKMLPLDAVAVLRNLLIWVEWDEPTEVDNGRQGNAVAVYYGGHQLQLLRKGKHPLKAKSITILSMKGLTEEHQTAHDSGRCVILHEAAHAVHSELLGSENESVKAAFYQAMQRKLYDLGLYASTNEHEFFAELTCAYFDQLHYYPKTRTDLEKHDPFTYKLLEQVWGRRPVAATKPGKPSGTDTGETMDPKLAAIQLESIDLGQHVAGPAISAADLKGQPTMLLLWNANSQTSLACFTKVVPWYDELRGYGLMAVALHLTGTQQVDVAQAAASRNVVTLPIYEAPWRSGDLVADSKDFPLCLVFDHAGACVFRGTPFEAEPALRQAVGQSLVAAAGVAEFPKPLVSLVEALRDGQPPASVLPKLANHARSANAKVSGPAKSMLDRITTLGQQQLQEAQDKLQSDPVSAYLLLEPLPQNYKSTPVGRQASQLLGKLKRQKPVQLELQARRSLTIVQRLDAELSSRPGAFDPSQAGFQRDNAPLLVQLQAAVRQTAQQWPQSRAAKEAIGIGEKYGLAGQ